MAGDDLQVLCSQGHRLSPSLESSADAIFLRRGRAPIEQRLVLFARGEGPTDLPGHGNRGAPIAPLD